MGEITNISISRKILDELNSLRHNNEGIEDILIRLLKTWYEDRGNQPSTSKSKRSEILWWEGDYRQDNSNETSARRRDS